VCLIAYFNIVLGASGLWDCTLQFGKLKFDLGTKFFAFALNYNLTLFYIVILYMLYLQYSFYSLKSYF
jgi:hypothetical protein